jgi:hypothetical protein
MASMTELQRAERWIEQHRSVLREIGEHWAATGEWKTVDQLGRAALRRNDEEDVFAALRDLPPALGRVEPPEDIVRLRVRGLAITPSTQPLLQEFIRVLRLAVLKLKSEDEHPRICRADLTESLHLGQEIAERVGQIVLENDWMFGGGSGDATGDWERVVNEHTRAVATVKNVDDYLQLDGQRFWARPANVWPEAAPLAGVLSPPPGSGLVAKIALASENLPHPSAVAVAYGRDDAAREAVFGFLRALGLKPLEWEQLVRATRSAAPSSGEAVERGFAAARAVVVLFTPDDRAQLDSALGHEKVRLQARPNVLLEAGMALATHPDRTVLVVIGDVDLPSNLSGRNFLRLGGTTEQLVAFAGRLEAAGCPVDRAGSGWLDTRAFGGLSALSRAPAAIEHGRTQPTTRGDTDTLRVAINELFEELEYADHQVAEDSHAYWAQHQLPTTSWQRHGALLALHDDEAHAALRAAYHELDRLGRCIATNGRTYGPMGDYDEHYTVNGCDPEKWSAAYQEARRCLRAPE